MCGFAGFIDANCETGDEALVASVRRMTETLWHRGPDQGGEWVDARDGIGLGTRRLAILDLSPLGDQPMVSRSGRYVLGYNGEIYNFRALRRELSDKGRRFAGHSDTEVLITAIEEWGLESALRRCNGMFAFALWDRSRKTLHLARDRVGEKPLFYGWMGRQFLFGSELKALRAHSHFQTEVNRDALALYMRHKYVPTPYSIYRGIRKLDPGTILTIRSTDVGGDGTVVPFWSAREAAERGALEPFGGSAEDATERLDCLLSDAVKSRMEADVPLGSFLSGGVDSSIVVALMQGQSGRPVKTFSIGLPEARYNEAPYAKEVAHHLGTDHTELYLTPNEVTGVIPRLPYLYDEPFSDSSQIPSYLISELARRHVTVSLSGDGGDELFGGYNRYAWVDKIWKQTHRLPKGFRGLAANLLTSLSPRRWETLFELAGPVLPAEAKLRTPGDKLHKLAAVLQARDPGSMYLGLVSHWTDPTAIVVGGREGLTAVTDRKSWADLEDFTHQMMYLDLVTYLPDDILTKVDRASMGVSLEARVPFLDHRVVEFAWRLPLAMKIREGQSKWLLRRVLDRYVPRALIERPKAGFGVPIDSWLRGPLRDWTEALIDERRLKDAGFLNPAPIRKKWTEHLSGRRNWQYHLWDVLMFQSWLETTCSPPTASVTHRVA